MLLAVKHYPGRLLLGAPPAGSHRIESKGIGYRAHGVTLTPGFPACQDARPGYVALFVRT